MQNYDTKQIFVWGAVILAIVGLFVGLVYLGSGKPPVTTLATAVSESTDRIKGPNTAKVTLVEYSDFECPACAQYEPILKQLLETYEKELRLVYRHYPLVQIHPQALPSAQASEAAHKQGKFWEMHEILFDRQSAWSKAEEPLDLFISYAKELGLDESKFTADMESSDVEEKITADMAGAIGSGITGTPTFFLNGKKISPRSFDEFKNLIDTEISNAGQPM